MKSRRPVRVSFLIDRLSHGGTESQLLALIEHLNREVVEPNLVLLDGSDQVSQSLEPNDCPTLRLGLTTLKNPIATSYAADRLRRFWKVHRVEIVQTYFLDSTYFGVPLARACGIKHVIRVRNNVGHWLTPSHVALGRLMGRLAHRTLTNSEPGRLAILRAEGGSHGKLVVLENGVDLERFIHLSPPQFDSSTTIGTVANLRSVKGLDILVHAAKNLLQRIPHLNFEVAGEGPQRSDLEKMIQDYEIQNRFRLIGQANDVPEFLSNIDVAVLPSRAEGMSNAILEFMAAARPIVATDVGANRQLLDNGKCGLIVEPNDPQALADALEQIVVNPILSSHLAVSARRRAVEHYSRAAMRQRFEAFYQRLCA